jgi:two-component system OmpR family sensor kinase
MAAPPERLESREGRGARRGPPPDRRPLAEDLKVPAGLFVDYYFVVWYRDGSVLKRSAGAPEGLARPAISQRDTLPHYRTRLQYREALHCSGLGDCVLAGRSVEEDLAALRNFAWMLFGAGGAVLALGLGMGFWFTARAIRPIEKISAAASRISHGNLSERVEGAGSGDELGNLAEVLNSTFARLEAAFLRQRQFTADAAHELRTPLAVIISEAQTTLARERAAADYRETVEACLETAQQMRRLTESLLELARFDGREEHACAEVDVAEAARAAVERIRPLAERHGIAIESALALAQAWCNAERIGQVITNLLANAIYYNKAGGKVNVATESFQDRAEILVSDTGVGISAEDLAHIFDRFYRVGKARSRAEGHVGLGSRFRNRLPSGREGALRSLAF